MGTTLALREQTPRVLRPLSDLATVQSKSTVANDSESTDEFIMTHKTVVRFVQDSIAEVVDRQKRNADKNGKANVLLFNEGDLFLLFTVNLSTSDHPETNG